MNELILIVSVALFLSFAIIALYSLTSPLALWGIFKKAGKPGWTAFIPIYNLFILLQIIDSPTYWIIFLFIPFVNIIFFMVIDIKLAKAFGKSSTWGEIYLWILPFIGYFALAFGSTKYIGAKKESNGNSTLQQPSQPLSKPGENIAQGVQSTNESPTQGSTS